MVRSQQRDNVLQIDAGVGNHIQFTKLENAGLFVEIESDWAGSTETGFGATTSITLDASDVDTFLKWLCGVDAAD